MGKRSFNDNLGDSILKVGQKVKLDRDFNSQANPKFLNKTFKVEGFWFKGKVIKRDSCIDTPEFRNFSGIVIKDRLGRKYNVNRFQLKRR